MGVFTSIGLLLSFILVYIITIIGFSYMNLNFIKTKPVLNLKRWNQSAFIHWLNRITWDYKHSIIIGLCRL